MAMKDIARILLELSDEEIAELLRQQPAAKKVARQMLERQLPSDPLEFAEKALDIKLWEKQRELIETVKKHRFTVVEAGHGVGKSFAAAVVAAWWLSTFENSVLITTAPTANLVQNILWRRIRGLHRNAKIPLPGRVLETPRWEIGPEWFGIGLSPRKDAKSQDFTALQGFHAVKLLVILDEAGGLPRNIFESAESLVTSEESRLLAIGNPVAQSGPFYEATQSGVYRHIRISCLDHPNVKAKREIIPGAVSYEWVRERFEKWARPCEPHELGAVYFAKRWWKPTPILQARVLGIPPEESEDKLVSTERIEWAHIVEADPGSPWVMAVDPAHGGGAQTAVVVRAGQKVVGIWRRDFRKTEQVGKFVMTLLARFPQIDFVLVDEIGIGAGVLDWLRDQGVNARGINFGSRAVHNTRFFNLRSELFWRLGEMLRDGKLSLPRDDMLDGELSALEYDYDASGRIRIVDKDKLEQILGRSIDSVDALAMTMMVDEPGAPLPVGSASGDEAPLSTPSRWVISAPRRQSRWSVR